MDLLIIAPNDYDALLKKGVIYQYENYRENNYFENVISLFPFNKKTITTEMDENKFFYQYGWMGKSEFLNKLKISKILGSFMILLKVFFIFPFIIKKYNIKVIRATDPYFMGLIGLFYSKLFRIPLLVSVHSDYELCGNAGGQTVRIFGSRKYAKILEKFVYKKSTEILPISNYLINQIRLVYPELEMNKFRKFPHGIEVRDFDLIDKIDIYKEFNIPKDKKLITYVARLSKEKNCLDIPLIASSLKKMMDDFVILIFGHGGEFEFLKNELTRLNLVENIRMVGFQSKEMVFNARKMADVNICLLDGYSLIEAGLSAKPVVAYDVEWHKELIVNEESGFLVELHDYNSFAEKIFELCFNKELSQKFGNNLRELTLKFHSLQNTQKIKQNIYQDVLERSFR